MNNQDKLKELKNTLNLSNQDIAEKSGYSIHSIRAFLLPETSKCHRRLSDRALELISLKLGTMGRVQQ